MQATATACDPGDDDRDRLNRLFQRYYERVRAIVRARLGPKLRTRVESGDIEQEAFAAALESFHEFQSRDEASLIQWLSKLVERRILAGTDVHGAKERGSEQKVSQPGMERVLLCLEQLSEAHREVILWRDFSGASWEAVAEETGCPSAAAARMLHARALVELAKLLRREA